MTKVDFSKIAGRIYAGRPNGIKARSLFDIENCDSMQGKVEVIFPENARSISSSFFLGMFGDSIRKFGSKEKFQSHYAFKANPQISKQIDKVIDRALVAMAFNSSQ